MTLAVENIATVTAFSTVSSKTMTGLNTSGADRILLLFVHTENDSVRPAISSVVQSGVTWTRRKQLQFGASNGTTLQNYELWWAYAPSQLTSASLTVTLDNTCDDGTIIYCAVSGVDSSRFTNPFDTNASLPGADTNPTATGAVPNVTISTDSADTIVFCAWGEGISNTGNQPTTGVGWTNIAAPTNVGAVHVSKQQAAYKVFATQLSGASANGEIGSTANWGYIVDAISGDVAVSGSSGTMGPTEAKDTFAATGYLPLTGTMAPTGAKDTFAASGGVFPTGTMGATEGKDTLAATGYPQLTGTWASTEAIDTIATSGGSLADLTLDSFATGEVATPAGGPVPTSVSATISTTFDDDVIVVMIATGGFWDYSPVASVHDTAGLTWKRRATHLSTFANTAAKSVEIWWAHAPTPLSADVITVNFTGGTGQAVMNVIAIGGANYSAPWDVHAYANQWNFRSTFGGTIETGFTSSHATKTMNLLMSAGRVAQSNATTAFPYTFLGVDSASEHNGGSTLSVATCYTLYNGAQDQTLVEFGPNGNSFFFSDSIVQAGQTGTANEVPYWFDGYIWQIGSGRQLWPSGVIQFSGANGTVQCQITTVSPNEVIVAAVSLFNAGGAGQVSSIADSAGLASGWTRRSRKTSIDGKFALEVWYALAPTALNSVAITAHTTGTVANDYAQILAFGIVGATYFYDGVLWDGDSTLPDEATYTSGTTAIGQVVTGMSTINVNTLDLAFMSNIDTAGVFNPAPGGAASFPDALGPYANTNAPLSNIGVLFKFSHDPLTADLMSSSVSAKEWITIGDAIPVGLPQPPTGVWGSQEGVDIWSAAGFVPAFGTMNPTEAADTTGGAPNIAPFTGVGWLGWVPAFATLDATDSLDRASARGWVIGAPLTGTLGATESKDRAALSNRATVTGTMGLTESRDRLASSGFEIPKASPAPLRKRRVVIVS